MFKLLFICSVLGVALAQRGHYAGNSRPIVGSRYEGTNGNNGNNVNTARPVQNSLTPTQSNFPSSQGNPQQYVDNRYNDNQGFGNQQQPFGFGGPVFPFQGFNQQAFPFAPNGFYGRRR
jgi:hypothetical protein